MTKRRFLVRFGARVLGRELPHAGFELLDGEAARFIEARPEFIRFGLPLVFLLNRDLQRAHCLLKLALEFREFGFLETLFRHRTPPLNGVFFGLKKCDSPLKLFTFVPEFFGFPQNVTLLPRFDHGRMSVREVVKLRRELIGHRERARLLKHEVPQERVEVSEVLRRLGLCEKFEIGRAHV